MKTVIEKLEEVLAELKAKEQEEVKADNSQVELSTLAAGQRIKTGIGNFIILGHSEEGTKVIQEGFFAEEVKFDASSPDYTKSELKKMFDTEILEAYEKEFGSGYLVEHTVALKTVDMQDYGTFTCKVRPITFEEARESNALLVKEDLPDWWWTCTPWSTEERGWGSTVAVVSARGCINGGGFDCHFGVRPFCILKSNIFVSRVEE